MGLAIRKQQAPLEVKVGGAVFLVNRLTYARRAAVMAEVRKAGDGVLDIDRLEVALRRDCLAGWSGVVDEETGAEIPFGPCPACAAPGAPVAGSGPVTPGAGGSGVLTPVAGQVRGSAEGCSGCGGSGDCRDWAIRAFPDALWAPLLAEATRVLNHEEALLKN